MEEDYRRLQPVKLDIMGNETGRERVSTAIMKLDIELCH
jgi:hypothetical protein